MSRRGFSSVLILGPLLCIGVAAAAPKNNDGSGTKKPAPVSLQADSMTGSVFVRLPAGCFEMGSPQPVAPKKDNEWDALGIVAPIDEDERPVHRVCVDAFAIGQTEVTAEAWVQVMGELPPHGRGKEPAAGVSWKAVSDFVRRLNEGRPDAHRYRLPTEAEWEYACRAGEKHEPQRFELELIEGAWYGTLSRYRPQASEVARLPANAWGLHDMLGNVWEWTSEMYQPDAYARHTLYNPRTATSDTAAAAERAIRGGSFRSEYLQVRCAVRSRYDEGAALPQIGFRLVLSP